MSSIDYTHEKTILETSFSIKGATHIAYYIDLRQFSWSYVISYALGWYLMPFMCIASKLFNKEIRFGVFKSE